ncbi:IclR family transcriptional regulator [Microbacterium album]|uniref:IclR family transcriptional regulator n=1 Tax=Microbacterium album TaxID=2053191 RepID=A0A917IGJ7_9MICO|nr:IclR family transcriptional regulator [Microbacterium album]GGH48349.1 IclR family transcriptional regulator [Microbacterium album]
MPRTNDPGRSVSSRVFDLLFAFGPDHSALTLAELERRTGLSHATARRLLGELVGAGLLERGADGRFTIGLRLWRLGTLAPHTESLRTLAQPFMEDLYAALKQHVQLAVLRNDEAVIIDRRSAPSAVRVVSGVGGRLPLHSSAVGKVLLSHADAARIDAVLARPLRAYTPDTITDPERIRAELAACRQTGIAKVRGELTPGVDSVATRILDSSGRVVAALSVLVDGRRVHLSAAEMTLFASGLGISRLLGWRPGVQARVG